MAAVIYSLCALAALFCAWLLLQAYRRSHYKLLLWGGLCFIGLTLNNILLIIDKLVVPTCLPEFSNGTRRLDGVALWVNLGCRVR